MRRLAALMTLIAAMTGTPLRQAEAAADLCRAEMERIQPSDIETPDGGVGDDAEVGIASGPQVSGLDGPLSLATPQLLPTVPTDLRTTPAELEALREAVWRPPIPPKIRHAWLQTFRF